MLNINEIKVLAHSFDVFVADGGNFSFIFSNYLARNNKQYKLNNISRTDVGGSVKMLICGMIPQ